MINYSMLHNYCNMSIRKIRKLGVYTQCTHNSGYTFIDNNSDILAVAHIDTVQSGRKFHKSNGAVFSPRFDDRLGVYTLLEQLRDLKFDVLLTEDEEMMNSTAAYFKPTKKYKWVFQFDRSGTDAVLYQYETDANCELLENAGYSVGIGSYTDICELGSLECAGFNFGTAYYKGHSLSAYMRTAEYLESVQKFRTFYAANCTTHLEHTPDMDYTSVLYGADDYIYDRWNQWYYVEDSSKCAICDSELTPKDYDSVYTHGMCKDCVSWVSRYTNG